MIELKFRGICIETGKMLYGSLLKSYGDYYIDETMGYDSDDLWVGIGFKQVINESVGQYTGIKDKAGIEIYSGDTVNCIFGYCVDGENHEAYVGEVEFSHAQFICSGKMYLPLKYAIQIEVIGNKFENPELLEKPDARN